MAQTPLEYTNGAVTDANGGIAQAGATLTVTDGSVFPATGNFLVWIWDWATYPDPNDDPGGEVLLCTARSGNALTVTRAQEGTSDQLHATGERVALNLTAEGMNRLWDGVAERVLLVPGLTTDNIVTPTAAHLVPLTIKAHASQTAALLEIQTSAAASLVSIGAAGDLTFADGIDLTLGTSTGSKLGTAATQKLGFYNATPVVQPSGATQGLVTVANVNGAIAALTVGASYVQAEVVALRDATEALADDVRAVGDLALALRTAMVNLGLIKGSA